MNLDFLFFFEAVMLGVGLAMDAFSVSLANGLNEPKMRIPKIAGIAGVFAGFQALMPLAGWFCVTSLVGVLDFLSVIIPWCSLGLLGFIGGKMLFESLKPECTEEMAERGECELKKPIAIGAILIQGVATSIDALSVGFTIADYNIWEALISVGVIALVTFPICFAGMLIGQRAGSKLAGKAGILGGAILIFIGLEIFITSWF